MSKDFAGSPKLIVQKKPILNFRVKRQINSIYIVDLCENF